MSEMIEKALGELGATVRDLKSSTLNRVDAIEARLNRGELAGGGNVSSETDKRVLAAEFFSAVQGRPVKPEDADASVLDDYRRAFWAYLRRGESSLTMDLRNAMSVGSDPDGGFWAPPEVGRDIVRRSFETSPMRRICSSITIGAEAIELPKDTNDLSGGGWVGETGSRPTTDHAQVGMQRFTVHEQYEQPKVTQKLLDDAGLIDIEAWLNGKIASKLGRRENTAFVSGNGIAKPRGFLSYASTAVTTDDDSRDWGVLQYTPSGASGAFPTLSGSTAADASAITDTVANLKDVYRANARWVFNRQTAATLAKLRDADGRSLWYENLANSEPDRLAGYPVFLAEDMPAIGADSYSIAFGDFQSAYLIVDRPGIRLLRDPFTDKPNVLFYTTKRVGGDVRDFDALKLIKFSTS